MKKIILALAILITALAGKANAAIDFTQYISEAQVLAQAGDVAHTDVEFGGIGFINPDGSKALFFDTGGLGTTGQDSMYLYDNGAISVYFKEAQFEATVGGGISENDITQDSAGNVYFLGRRGAQTFLAKFPANQPYTAKIELADPTTLTGANHIALDEANNRVYLGYTASFATGNTRRLSYVALNAVNATPTDLTNNTAILASIASTVATNDNCADICLLSTGDVLYSNGFSPLANAQTSFKLLKIDKTTGSVSIFTQGDTLVAAAGGIPGTHFMGNALVKNLSNGRILALVVGTSSTTAVPRSFLMGSADGTQWAKVVNEAQAITDVDFSAASTTPLQAFGSSLEMDTAGNVYWGSGGTVNEAIVKMSGLDINMDLTADDPDIQVASSINFGTVTNGGSSTKVLTIKNTGATQSLTVSNASTITGSARFTKGAGLPVTLTPGQSTTINVTFAPITGDTGVLNGTLTLVSNDSDSAQAAGVAVALTGAALIPNSIPLIISQIVDGNTAGGQPKAIELSNSGTAAVDLSQFSLKLGSNGNPFGSPLALTGSLAAGASYTLSATDTTTNSPTAFVQIVGSAPDLINSIANINGDDTVGLFNAAGTIMYDIFGEEGVDADASPSALAPWLYADSTFTRKGFVHSGSTTWSSGQWTKLALSTTIAAETAEIGSGATGSVKLKAHTFTSNNATTHWELFQ